MPYGHDPRIPARLNLSAPTFMGLNSFVLLNSYSVRLERGRLVELPLAGSATNKGLTGELQFSKVLDHPTRPIRRFVIRTRYLEKTEGDETTEPTSTPREQKHPFAAKLLGVTTWTSSKYTTTTHINDEKPASESSDAQLPVADPLNGEKALKNGRVFIGVTTRLTNP
jgi:hypothetical protein